MDTNGNSRPLSPHLQIYRPNLLMVMSILHRITGAFLPVPVFLGIWWLAALASSGRYFAEVNGLLASWPGRLVLVVSLYALLHHAFSGLRYLVWDAGAGLDVPAARRLSLGALLAAIAGTLLVVAVFVIRTA